tara:strand:+ start:2199 stop:2402 length:204 start_codon:yes stop_codon:yes gene_type:complete
MANLKTIQSTRRKKTAKGKKLAGLLDGTLEQKIRRLEKLTSPNQRGAGTKELQKSIDKLRKNIRMSA